MVIREKMHEHVAARQKWIGLEAGKSSALFSLP
jgi:hypothetical protein